MVDIDKHKQMYDEARQFKVVLENKTTDVCYYYYEMEGTDC